MVSNIIGPCCEGWITQYMGPRGSQHDRGDAQAMALHLRLPALQRAEAPETLAQHLPPTHRLPGSRHRLPGARVALDLLHQPADALPAQGNTQGGHPDMQKRGSLSGGSQPRYGPAATHPWRGRSEGHQPTGGLSASQHIHQGRSTAVSLFVTSRLECILRVAQTLAVHWSGAWQA